MNINELYVREAMAVRVVDGDTIDFSVDTGFHQSIQIRTRLLGIDTPERGEINWANATNFVAERVLARNVLIKTFKYPGDKYGRWLAKVQLPDGSDLGEALIAAGLAKPYGL